MLEIHCNGLGSVVLFFGVVAVGVLFFSVGYLIGRRTEHRLWEADAIDEERRRRSGDAPAVKAVAERQHAEALHGILVNNALITNLTTSDDEKRNKAFAALGDYLNCVLRERLPGSDVILGYVSVSVPVTRAMVTHPGSITDIRQTVGEAIGKALLFGYPNAYVLQQPEEPDRLPRYLTSDLRWVTTIYDAYVFYYRHDAETVRQLYYIAHGRLPMININRLEITPRPA